MNNQLVTSLTNKIMIKVSDQFKNITININESDQTSEMSKLSKQEFYLLLLFCIDNYNKYTNRDVVKSNLKFYSDYLDEIKAFMKTKKTDNEILNELATLTNVDIITTLDLVDSDEQPIRNIFEPEKKFF